MKNLFYKVLKGFSVVLNRFWLDFIWHFFLKKTILSIFFTFQNKISVIYTFFLILIFIPEVGQHIILVHTNSYIYFFLVIINHLFAMNCICLSPVYVSSIYKERCVFSFFCLQYLPPFFFLSPPLLFACPLFFFGSTTIWKGHTFLQK